MKKAVLIFSAIGFVLAIGTFQLFPWSGLCIGIFLGLGAGYMINFIERPIDPGSANRLGAMAGFFAAPGLLSGNFVVASLNTYIAADGGYGLLFLENLMILIFQDPLTDYMIASIFSTQLLIGCCMGVINLGLVSVFGSVGGSIWFGLVGRKRLKIPDDFL